jgi:hypothetical protein
VSDVVDLKRADESDPRFEDWLLNLCVELKRADKPDPRFEDWLLNLCAEWRICRATMEINRAL